MLEVRDATFSYPSAPPTVGPVPPAVLDGMSFAVRAGERVAVLGPNGSGKSTLLRLLAGQVAPAAGQVVLDDAAASGPDGRGRLRRAAGLVGQDPDDQMVASTVFEEVAFGPCNLGLPLDELRARCTEALEACGLAGLEGREVAALSGGQRQRLALAGVLAMRPTYLLCDEPCSMLDPQGRREVLAVLAAMVACGRGVVHVTHELSEALACDRAVVVRGGRVVWEGAPAALLRDGEALRASACLLTPWLEAARALMGAGLLSDDAPVADPAACAALVARGGEAAAGRARRTACAAVGDGAGRPAHAAAGAGRGLRVQGASFAYGRLPRRGEPVWAVRDADLEVPPGATVLVAGRTGSGKSTLARLAAGLLRPARGAVSLDGGAAPAPGRVGYAFQRAEDQLFADTVLDDAAFGPANLGASRDEARSRAERALKRVGLDPARFGPASPFALSGGQMRRAALAGVLALEAPYLVLDEPTAGLDADGMRDLAGIMRDLVAHGTGVAVVSHDVGRVGALADRAVLLDAGRVAWSGPARGLRFGPDGLGAFLDALGGVSVPDGGAPGAGEGVADARG